MKIILLLLLLTPTAFAYQVEEYKGLQVTHEIGLCPEWASACYYHESNNVNMEIWRWPLQYKRILDHEYAHHVHITLMSEKHKALWVKVTNKEIMLPILKKHSLNSTIEFAGWYASASIYEDFAESAYRRHNGELTSYLDLKILVAKYLLAQYN